MGANLGVLVDHAARTSPDHPAVVFGESMWTYGQWLARIQRLAGAFRQSGVGRDDRVAVLSANRPEILEVFFAAWRIGAVVVPMNYRLHRDEVAYILQHSQAKALVYEQARTADVEVIRPSCPDTQLWIGIRPDDAAADDFPAYETLVREGPVLSDVAPVEGDDLAWLFYTSGTTGRPKGAMLTHRILLLMTLNVCTDIYPFSRSDVALHTAPLSHGSGLYALALVAKGATQVIHAHARFDPEQVLEDIAAHQVTVLPFLAPTMVKRLTSGLRQTNRDVPSLRCIIYGGAPMYVEDMLESLEAFGPIFAQVYGQGECPMSITGMDRAAHRPDDPVHLGSVGTPRTGVEVAVVDEQGNRLPVNTPGEVVVRSDMVMKGYWSDPEATRRTVIDGWLHTGDIGYFDERGNLFLLDRSKDLIISGGSNIYPREVEEVLLRHPGVAEACVFGIPDPEWGEAVKAVVVRKPGWSVTEEELIAFCQQHLTSYKKPRVIGFADSLPKNAYGKVLKRELRAAEWAQMNRQI
jgi:acyl-CoA synthetase (AMP-forming)/AMP-acid ligase II